MPVPALISNTPMIPTTHFMETFPSDYPTDIPRGLLSECVAHSSSFFRQLLFM